jgi:hypothetical protein
MQDNDDFDLQKILENTLDESQELVVEQAEQITHEICLPESTIVINSAKERETDYDFARKNLRDIITTSKEALEQLQVVAEQSQHPRAYEVVASLVNALVDANTKLLDIHKQKLELEIKEKTKDLPINNNNLTQNNLFVGSSAQLLEFAKQLNKQAKKESDEDA